jgi:hypothetical protein
MNIFYLNYDTSLCAEWAVDRHVVKMILESAQMLSTAHRVLDGTEYYDWSKNSRRIKRWSFPKNDSREAWLYKATHVNHPCSVWARESEGNYIWLWSLLKEYCKEYTYRYGKVHKVESSSLLYALRYPPYGMKKAYFFEPPSAMDDKYIISDRPEINYQNYYIHGKSHLHKWTGRRRPLWIPAQ